MKIFGIGLSKTGTTSLAHALEILGYATQDNMGITRYAPDDISSIDISEIESHDAFTDTPIPTFYKQLDERFQGAKFILTVRDLDGWLKSCKKQFTRKSADNQTDAHNQLFTDLYGTAVFDEDKFRAGYEKFVNDVYIYFMDRPQDLLVMDVTAGDGWEKLCPFLGKSFPEVPFPKANVTQITWININDIVELAKQAGYIHLRAYRQTRRSDLLGKALTALRGGASGTLRRSRLAAHDMINGGLKKFKTEIPILSRLDIPAPYSTRVKWNHVWLVDPLDGEEAFFGSERAFTVNIALIQDGLPIYGVVYAPVTNTVYYARIGKGAFKVKGTGKPQRLQASANRNTDQTTTAPSNQPAVIPASRALAICMVADGRLDSFACDEPSQECETAAAHLIATNSGKWIHDCRSKHGLKYNKALLLNECFVVE